MIFNSNPIQCKRGEEWWTDILEHARKLCTHRTHNKLVSTSLLSRPRRNSARRLRCATPSIQWLQLSHHILSARASISSWHTRMGASPLLQHPTDRRLIDFLHSLSDIVSFSTCLQVLYAYSSMRNAIRVFAMNWQDFVVFINAIIHLIQICMHKFN